MPPLTAVETKQLAYCVLTDAQKHRFEESLELDISFGVKGLARFRANIFMQRGAVAGGLPDDPLRDPRLQGAGAPAGRRALVRQAPRADPGHRPDRLGQVDHAGGDDRQDQQRAPRAHRHHRGPDRVPALAQEVHGQPARAARRHPLVPGRPAVGAARGPRRGADRRDARPRDHRVGAAHRRDRPPHLRHPAHQLGAPDHQPHHRRLPGAPADADPHPAEFCSRGDPLPGIVTSARAARAASWRWKSWCPTRPSAT